MSATPLTARQLAAVDALLQVGSLDVVPADQTRASAFLRKARIKIADISNTQHPENRFALGYGACHDVGEALLAAYGYRTRAGVGQHVAVGGFLAAVIAQPPGSTAAARFNRLRRIRNNQNYRAQSVSEAEAQLAGECADDLLASAISQGLV